MSIDVGFTNIGSEAHRDTSNPGETFRPARALSEVIWAWAMETKAITKARLNANLRSMEWHLQ
jgi:hypothetical protein